MRNFSLKDVKYAIPDDAISLFSRFLSPSQINQILIAFREKRNTTFRINLLKANEQIVISNLKKTKFKIKKLNIFENVFSLQSKSDSTLLKSNEAKQGAIYLQSITSMLPPIILAPNKNENILDVAAAPGSKTSQIAAMISNTGHIDAIEPNKIRLERLQYNLNILGVTNTSTVQDYGERIYKKKQNFYNRTIADVPCSGEGRFNLHDKASYSHWRLKNINKFSTLQLKILKSAIHSTKIGGTIVYSTCTLNPLENENVINKILNDKNLSVKIIPINNEFKEFSESIEPILSYNGELFNSSIKHALRILPSKRMEGFFICKMQRL